MTATGLDRRALRNPPVADIVRAALASVQIVPHDAKIVESDMCELWASRAIAHASRQVASSISAVGSVSQLVSVS